MTRWRELGFMGDGGYGIPQSVTAAAARYLINEGRSIFRHPQAVLLVTTWPERDGLAHLQGAGDRGPVAQSTPAPTRLPAAGRRVATRFAEAYFTSTGDDSGTARAQRLTPYSSDALIAEMRVNSGALALQKMNTTARAASKADVVALQEQDGTSGQALVAIVERTTTVANRSSTELVTVTLELVEHDGVWVVTEVLVP